MLTGKVTGQGQATLPPEVLERLDLKEESDPVWHAAVSTTVAEEWDSPEEDEAFADLQGFENRGR